MDKKILIVEDDEFLQELAATKLMKAGFKVEVAPNGEQAIKKFDAGYVPDCMLLDIMMPGSIDGFGILEHVRKTDAMKTIPVITFSNLADDESIMKAKSLGANDFMIKSNFTLDELVAKVLEILK
jgi:chemosensory pili system protein ChpA (sensor histidine kinase/response regulator)/putative two-component system response regulator